MVPFRAVSIPILRCEQCFRLSGWIGTFTKDGGLMRQLSCTKKSLHFIRAQFFNSHSHFLDALSCRWPATNCNVYDETEGATGDNLHCLRFALSRRQVGCTQTSTAVGSNRTYKIFAISITDLRMIKTCLACLEVNTPYHWYFNLFPIASLT